MTSTPNIVFIFTDQQRFDTLGAYGNEHIQTPNLNKLAHQSAVFEHAYVSQPVCTPSRATILTGLYPQTHRLVKNNLVLAHDVPTIAELIKGSPYRSGYFGKWHLGDETVLQHGFDEWISTEDYYYRDHVSKKEYRDINSDYHRFLVEKNYRPDIEDGDYAAFSRLFATRIPARHSKPAFLAGEADRFIKENKNDPFLLYINFLEPHPPYHSAFDKLYDPEEVDLPPNFRIPLANNLPAKYRQNANKAAQKGRHFPLNSEQAWRKQIARYWGCISLVDTYAGKILDSIEKHGIGDKTIFVFTSDHGDMMGDFGMLAKGVMYNSATRVPLLMKVPGFTNQSFTITEPVSHIDLVATMLDMMGLPWKGRTQGKSLYPVIKGEEKLLNNDVFIEHKTGSDAAERTIISGGKWRLTHVEPDGRELYDLNNDPLERENIYFDENRREQVSELTRRLTAWDIDTARSHA